MKKILLMAAVVCALALSACGNKAADADAVVTDSIEVVEDSVAVNDSIVALDSVVETVDTCACK